MDKKNEIQRIWTECFSDTPQWIEMYFDRVYRDDCAMTLSVDNQTVSSLLLLRYDFLFQGRIVPAAYVAGAATRRQARGRGYMGELMREALRASRDRGDMLCSLIPAHDWLYFYYDRFGFTTVFYVDMQRFTSLHKFTGNGDHYHDVDDHFAPEIQEAMERMERLRGCGIIHTRRDFLNIMDDLRLERDARFVAIASDMGEICSMAWAVRRGEVVEVRELLSVDEEAAKAALRALRSCYPDAPFRIMAPATGNHRHLYSRGMARIVNAGLCLECIAAEHTGWKCAIRVYDRLLGENSHTYIIGGGRVRIDDSYCGHLDFDVTVEVLNAMVFSDKKTGEILGFPSERAHMALMLD